MMFRLRRAFAASSTMRQYFFAGLLVSLLLAPSAPAAERPVHAADRALADRTIAFEWDAAGRSSGIRAHAAGWVFRATAGEMDVLAGGESIRIRLEGARASARPAPAAPPTRTNQYFLGRESAPFVSLSFERFRFEGVYPGVDIEYYGAGGDVEYDFLVDAGGRVDQIVLAFDRPARIEPDGSLLLETPAGGLVQAPPAAFQGEQPVPVRYRALDERRIGFEVGAYDRKRPLRIDPRIGLASFFGGAGDERIEDATFDAQGALWIVGQTSSPDIPLPPSGFPSLRRGPSDVFASKFVREVDASGEEHWRLTTTLLLGGEGRDRAVGIAVDAAGRVYVMGDTQSRDFPISNDGEQRDLAGGTDAFLTVLRESDFPFFSLGEEAEAPNQGGPTNYEIEYSTLVGGAGEEALSRGFVAAFAEDRGLPCAVLAGQSSSADLPTTTFAFQEQNAGGTDAFFSVFCRQTGQGYPLVYGSFLGGSREEVGGAIAISSSGSFCVGTRTTSAGLAATGLQTSTAGGTESYLACFEPVRRRFGLPFLYRELGSTYWGGPAGETLIDVVIEDLGDGPQGFRLFALAESLSESIAFPAPAGTLPPGTSAANPGGRSLAVGVFPPALDRGLAQFWVGGSSRELGVDLALSGGCLVLAGVSDSADFLSSPGFPERPLGGGEDILAGKFCFDPQTAAAQTVYLGAHGSSADDFATTVAAGPFDDELIVGWTSNAQGGAPQLAITPSAPQSSYGGGLEDGLLLELYRPRLRPEAVVGAADFLSRPIAPGQIVTLFAAGIGPGALITAQLDESGRLLRELGGVRVLFDGEPAPMVFVSRNQVSAVAPFFLEVRSSVSVQVETDGALSEPVTLPVAPTAPAVFTVSQTGSGQAAVLNEDSSVNGPGRPAAAGSPIQIFLTGAGQTLPRGVDGELIPVRQPFPLIMAPVAVRIGGVEAAVIYAGGAPGLVHGVAQINVVTPRGLGTNANTPLEITIGGQSIQTNVTIAVAGTP